MVDSIFVYGTLKRGQLRETHWPHPPLSIQPGFIRARLYDLGPYPAIVAGSEPVCGEIWRFPENRISSTLDVLDSIEGYVPGRKINLYERITLPVYATPNQQTGTPQVAFVYQMESRKLPSSAKVIFPSQQFSGTEDQTLFAQWPVGNLPPNITSKLPDPYPDDIVG